MSVVRHAVTIPAEQDGRRLDRALAELLPDYSRSRIKAWIQSGCVRLDGGSPQPRTRVAAGQQVELAATMEADAAVAAQPVSFDIVHEDEEVLVVVKPAGLVVHPGAGNRDATLANGLRHHAPALGDLPRSGLLHRLDKDTSGLLLVAKTLPALTHLTRALQERRISREYRAIVNGVMTAGGAVDAPVGRHPVHRTRMAVTHGGRAAVTHYRVLARFAAHSFLAVRLETGRTHQIRVHMAHLGFPVVGDPAYGGRPRVPAGASPELLASLRAFRRQALHASALRFQHPASGESLQFSAPLPRDMHELLVAIAGSPIAAARVETLGMAGEIELITPGWPAPARVRAAATTRTGGVSGGAFASLNLGNNVGDDPESVYENRRRMAQALDLPAGPLWLHQVHGATVVTAGAANKEGARSGFSGLLGQQPRRLDRRTRDAISPKSPTWHLLPPAADAMVADAAGQVCALLTADCLPVLFCDEAGTRVAAAHAGWRGLAAGVLEGTVAALGRAGAQPGILLAWIGPAIGGPAYEVGAEVREAFPAGDRAAGFAANPRGRWQLDLAAIARRRLAAAGVGRVFGGELCTWSHPARFFSYRRDGACGRQATLIWMVPEL